MEVVGGSHIAPECITIQGSEFVMIEWPNGLPRHEDKRTVRFPHGMMRFGETIETCAERLIHDQLGMRIEMLRVAHLYSYVDDSQHWHIEPLVVIKVSGDPHIHPAASQVIRFKGKTLPEGAVWGQKTFNEAVELYLKPYL